MKLQVGVTGHTSGLGKAIFNFYSQEHSVLGFSRSNGYDLRDWSTMQKVIDQTANCDLIFSNAKPDFFQTVFLYEFVKRNNFRPKIVSIGSRIIDVDVDPRLDVGINLYKTQKMALQNTHQQLTQRFSEFKSVLIHPGHLYDKNNVMHTDLSKWVQLIHNIVTNNNSAELYVD